MVSLSSCEGLGDIATTQKALSMNANLTLSIETRIANSVAHRDEAGHRNERSRLGGQ